MFDAPTSPEPLPIEVQTAIDESVARFEARFQKLGMLVLARSSGWIKDYRAELEALALRVRG